MAAVIAAICALVVGAVGLSPVAGAQPSSTEKSILSVAIEWTGVFQMPDGGWTKPATVAYSCTGFFAGTNGEIVTAGHCVDPAKGDLKESIAARLVIDNVEKENRESVYAEVLTWTLAGDSNNAPLASSRVVTVVQSRGIQGAVITEPTAAQVVDFRPDQEGDLALLTVSNLSTATPALAIADSTPDPGIEVTAVGFPGSVSDLVDVNRIRPSFKQGHVSSHQTTDKGVPVTEIDAAVSGGMSGGPTLDQNGEVIGVNSFKNGEESQAFNFITDTIELKRFLASHDVQVFVPTPPPTTETPQAALESDSAGVPTWLIAVIAVVVAGALLAAVLFVRSRKANKVPAHAQAYGQQPGAGGFVPQQPACSHQDGTTNNFCSLCGTQKPPNTQPFNYPEGGSPNT